MPDAFDPRPPQELRAFYDKVAARHRAAGVCLSGYRLRWTAYRCVELDQGVERAMLDLAWGDEGVTRQAQFVARARDEAGPGMPLTFVEVGLKQSLRWGPGEPPVPVVLSITMWRSDHPCGLTGRIDLDAQARPTGASREPLPLVRMGG